MTEMAGTNSKEAPPDYHHVSDTTSVDESLVMVPIQCETNNVQRRRSRNEMIKRHACGIAIGVAVCLIVFLFCNALWKRFGLSQNETESDDSLCEKRIIGYYKGWDNRKITENQIEKLTHIIFDGTSLKEDGRIEFESDEQRLLFLDMKNKVRTMKSDVKIMFSTDNYLDNSDHCFCIMNDSKSRKNWSDSITSFVLEQQLDGVEIFYRWPDTRDEKDNYVYFIRELRYKFEKIEKMARRKVPYIISIVAPQSSWPVGNELFLHEILDYANFLNIETDKYYVPWLKSEMSGPLSPLYSWNNNNKSIDWTINAYSCKTLKPSQLTFMLPFRWVAWKGTVDSLISTNDLYRMVGKNKSDSESYAWRDLKGRGWIPESASWDDVSRTPYIWNSINRTLLTFDNERSMKEKTKYMILKSVGGISLERLEYDDDVNTLLNAIASVDMCSGPKFKKDEVRYSCGDSGFKQEYLLSSSMISNTLFLVIFMSFVFFI